jgi:hypothetical protein
VADPNLSLMFSIAIFVVIFSSYCTTEGTGDEAHGAPYGIRRPQQTGAVGGWAMAQGACRGPARAHPT